MHYLFTECLKRIQSHPKWKQYIALFVVLSIIYAKTLGIVWLLLIYIFLIGLSIGKAKEREKERTDLQNDWVIRFSEKTLLSFVGNMTIENAVRSSFEYLREDLPFESVTGGQHMSPLELVNRLEFDLESDHTRQLLSVISQCLREGSRIDGSIYYSWVKEMLVIKQLVMRGKMTKANTLVASCNLVIFLGMMLMMMLPSMLQLVTM